MSVVFNTLLSVIIVAVAAAVVLGRQAFMAVVFFIAYGLLVALAWLRLEATNVALAEAAIGAGLTGILLLMSWTRLRALQAPAPPRPTRLIRMLAGLGAVAVTLGLLAALIRLPAHPGLQNAVAERLPLTGTENPVTAVLLNFRGWDTLLETLVLLAALLGVWTVTRDEDWPGPAGRRHRVLPDGVLAQFGRVLPPVALVIGAYLIWAGGHQPGGAFQGGTVLAAAWVVAVMTGHLPAPRVDDRWMRAAVLSGPAFFLGVGVTGLSMGTFLWIPPVIATPLLMAIEITLAVAIAATLSMLVFGAPEREETP
ncbi:hydrogenase subunit MbhD domain-containing protein [Spiribacter vilamensis]|uniref:Multisubunit sodium/proton antiporter MrpB subunit n=1 Tax=Spiribacter vilamensis TaxID=531306 RepID=A0A4Q8D323_9GAMM|nr:hydrogenase subunit MbhD domain-containing protein [Spiribacter vilamensis]RZU99730.1 multisubunit sodium/proton antiporter MrpB subunit [Spiribacter vilamensis]TVO61324.1 DUF4040 domain-containing protein [Spiribacter vilamensis]